MSLLQPVLSQSKAAEDSRKKRANMDKIQTANMKKVSKIKWERRKAERESDPHSEESIAWRKKHAET